MIHAKVSWDQIRACWIVGETQDYLIGIAPMIFDHRVIMTPKDNSGIYVVGWCYPNMNQAHVAVKRWDPAENWKPDPSIPNFRPTKFLKEVGL